MPDLDETSVALGELREFRRSTEKALDEMLKRQERHHLENKDSIQRLAASTTAAIDAVGTKVDGVETEVAALKTANALRKGIIVGGSAVVGFLGGTAGGPVGKAIAALVAKIGGTP